MDSYPGTYRDGTYQASGIAMSCDHAPDKKCQPSLSAFWQGLSQEYEEKFPEEYDLRYLCEREGIMLTNRALNCKLFKTGSMMGKFDFFWKYFLEEVIAVYYKSVPILLLGKEAEKLRAYIFEMNNPIFTLPHPSYAARAGNIWETKGVFKQIDRVIYDNNKIKLNWRREVKKEVLINEEEISDCPF